MGLFLIGVGVSTLTIGILGIIFTMGVYILSSALVNINPLPAYLFAILGFSCIAIGGVIAARSFIREEGEEADYGRQVQRQPQQTTDLKRCSNCGVLLPNSLPNFCPNCGAKKTGKLWFGPQNHLTSSDLFHDL